MIRREQALHFWPPYPNAEMTVALDRLVEVRVVVDDDRVLAAHLGDHPFDVALPRLRLRCGRDDPEPDAAAARERNVVHADVLDERLPHLAARPRQVLDDAVRDARLVQQLDEPVRDDRATARPALGWPRCRRRARPRSCR